MERSPHIALLIDTVTIHHRILSPRIILWYDVEWPLILNFTRGLIVIKLVDGFSRAVGPEHDIVILVPSGAVRDLDVAERAVKREVRVKAEYGTVVSPLRHQGIEHEATPEAALRVHRAIITAHFFGLSSRNLLIRPYFLDPAILARFAVVDAEAQLAAEDELVIVAFDVCGDAKRYIQLAGYLVARGADVEVDGMDLAFLDVEEAERVCLVFPERAFAERAIELDPWLSRTRNLWSAHCFLLDW